MAPSVAKVNSSAAQAKARSVASKLMQETPSQPVSLNSSQDTVNWIVTSIESPAATEMGVGTVRMSNAALPIP